MQENSVFLIQNYSFSCTCPQCFCECVYYDIFLQQVHNILRLFNAHIKNTVFDKNVHNKTIEPLPRGCWTVLNKILEYTENSSTVRKCDVSTWKKNWNISRRCFWEKWIFLFLGKFRYVISTIYAIKSDIAGAENFF